MKPGDRLRVPTINSLPTDETWSLADTRNLIKVMQNYDFLWMPNVIESPIYCQPAKTAINKVTSLIGKSWIDVEKKLGELRFFYIRERERPTKTWEYFEDMERSALSLQVKMKIPKDENIASVSDFNVAQPRGQVDTDKSSEVPQNHTNNQFIDAVELNSSNEAFGRSANMTIQHAEWHPTDDEIRFENDAEIVIEEDKISVHGNNDKQDNNNRAIDAVELNSSNEAVGGLAIRVGLAQSPPIHDEIIWIEDDDDDAIEQGENSVRENFERQEAPQISVSASTQSLNGSLLLAGQFHTIAFLVDQINTRYGPNEANEAVRKVIEYICTLERDFSPIL